MECEWACLGCLVLYRNLVDQCMLCPGCLCFVRVAIRYCVRLDLPRLASSVGCLGVRVGGCNLEVLRMLVVCKCCVC